MSFAYFGGSLLASALAACLMIEGASGRAQEECEVADADPWVVGAIEATREEELFYRFAQEVFGLPISCEGRVAGEFDGAPFGEVRFRFPGEVTLEIETMPPLVRILTLTHAAGFPDPVLAQDAAYAYAEESGFSFDRTSPDRTIEGEVVREQYWDPEPGLNASLTFTWSAGRLVSIRVSSAP